MGTIIRYNRLSLEDIDLMLPKKSYLIKEPDGNQYAVGYIDDKYLYVATNKENIDNMIMFPKDISYTAIRNSILFMSQQNAKIVYAHIEHVFWRQGELI